jgi:hypothetical protein
LAWGGNYVKEPFIALSTITALVASSGIDDRMMADRIAGILTAGACSALFSWWKSRKRRADRTDTAIWALIALCGSMSFGWFMGPAIADRELLGLTMPGIGITTWLLAISGAPAVEWMLDGRAFKWALQKAGIATEETL